MIGTSLIRPIRSVAWELRGAWATGKRVALSLDERCDRVRVEGWVRTISATDAFVVVGSLHVPLDAVRAVHLPSLLGDSDWDGEGRFHSAGRQKPPPQDDALWLEAA